MVHYAGVLLGSEGRRYAYCEEGDLEYGPFYEDQPDKVAEAARLIAEHNAQISG